jgi:hypothetical protein
MHLVQTCSRVKAIIGAEVSSDEFHSNRLVRCEASYNIKRLRVNVAECLEPDNVLVALDKSSIAQTPLRNTVFPANRYMPDYPNYLVFVFRSLKFLVKPVELVASVVELLC